VDLPDRPQLRHRPPQKFFRKRVSLASERLRWAPTGPARKGIGRLRARIDDALAGFSERERAVFVLRHYHDLKIREIAQTLGITLGSVKSYLFRSIQKLQKALGDAEPCPDDGERP
jgi:DNA-directed RNA polymerase specialized sigma24 family protein